MPLQRRLPKRGFKSKLKYAAEITLVDLERLGEDEVDLLTLKAAGLVREMVKTVKVIKSGELKRKVVLKGIGATVGAKAAIEAAGGIGRPAAESSRHSQDNRSWQLQRINWPRAASSATCVAGWSSCCSRWWSTASVRTSRCRASTRRS